MVERLTREFPGEETPPVIEQEVRRRFAEWADAPVRDFVPMLAERRSRERLRELYSEQRVPAP